MARPLVFEYDPATGTTVASQLPIDLFPEAHSQAVQAVKAELPEAANAGGTAAPVRKLNESGKAKVRHYVISASSLDDLSGIDAVLDTGELTDEVAAKLQLGPEDFELPPGACKEEALPAALEPPLHGLGVEEARGEQPQLAAPLGALRFTASGLAKLKAAIKAATDVSLLGTIDAALLRGDVPTLQRLLALQPEEDVQPRSDAGDDDTQASTTDEEGEPAVEEEEEEYDPFDAKPAQVQQSEPATAKDPRSRPTAEVDAAAQRKRRVAPSLGSLLTAYGDDSDTSDKELPAAAKRPRAAEPAPAPAPAPMVTPVPAPVPAPRVAKKAKPKALPSPLEWAALVNRTQRHADFRPPTAFPDSRSAEEKQQPAGPPAMLMALATSMIYIGDTQTGYNPRFPGRVTAVSGETGAVLMDVIVRPPSPVLDLRPHITGLSPQSFEAGAADLETVRSQLLEMMHPETVLVGYRINGDLEALRLCHDNVVDVSLLFAVESRKQHQYHHLDYIAERVLGIEAAPRGCPRDPLEGARLAMKLAQREAKRRTPTKPFPPKAANPCELAVRHVPIEWREVAPLRISSLCPAAKRNFSVNWLANDFDPSDWRGECTLEFVSQAARDATFDALRELTDIHIQWDDVPGAPPLGGFLTEQALVKAFSCHGVVVCARIPRKAATREPQSFAFISFLEHEDAERLSRRKRVQVQITSEWSLEVRPRLAKFGGTTDKRVAIRPGNDTSEYAALDWLHCFRG